MTKRFCWHLTAELMHAQTHPWLLLPAVAPSDSRYILPAQEPQTSCRSQAGWQLLMVAADWCPNFWWQWQHSCADKTQHLWKDQVSLLFKKGRKNHSLIDRLGLGSSIYTFKSRQQKQGKTQLMEAQRFIFLQPDLLSDTGHRISPMERECELVSAALRNTSLLPRSPALHSWPEGLCECFPLVWRIYQRLNEKRRMNLG